MASPSAVPSPSAFRASIHGADCCAPPAASSVVRRSNVKTDTSNSLPMRLSRSISRFARTPLARASLSLGAAACVPGVAARDRPPRASARPSAMAARRRSASSSRTSAIFMLALLSISTTRVSRTAVPTVTASTGRRRIASRSSRNRMRNDAMRMRRTREHAPPSRRYNHTTPATSAAARTVTASGENGGCHAGCTRTT